MNKTFCIFALLVAIPLAGCDGERNATDEAVNQIKARCQAAGKEFVPLTTTVRRSQDWFFMETVSVSGRCVGPGDPGYVATRP